MEQRIRPGIEALGARDLLQVAILEIEESTPGYGNWAKQMEMSVLTPATLAAILPHYGRFRPESYGNGLHEPLVYGQHSESLSRLPAAETACLVVMGPSAGGQTSFFKEFIRQRPDLVARIRTATTRPPNRPEERKGPDYDHLTDEEFSALAAQSNPPYFIETIPQWGRLYGTPAEHVAAAIQSRKPIILWTGNPDGRNALFEWIGENNPAIPVITGFVLPTIPITELATRIMTNRAPREWLERMKDAILDIYTAPWYSDLLVLNPPTDSRTPEQAAAALWQYFRRLPTVQAR